MDISPHPEPCGFIPRGKRTAGSSVRQAFQRQAKVLTKCRRGT
jgi:hypothetical protein